MTTASTLKDIGEAGAPFGITTVTLYVQTRGDRRIVVTPTRPPRREGARAPARPKQLRGRGRLSVRGRGFSLSGRRYSAFWGAKFHFLEIEGR